MERIGVQCCGPGYIGIQAVGFGYLGHSSRIASIDRLDGVPGCRRAGPSAWRPRRQHSAVPTWLPACPTGPAPTRRAGCHPAGAYHLVVVLVVLLTELPTLGLEKYEDGTGVVRFAERAALEDRRLRRRRVTGNQDLRVVLGGHFVEGTNTLVTTATKTQNTTIGSANCRGSFATRAAPPHFHVLMSSVSSCLQMCRISRGGSATSGSCCGHRAGNGGALMRDGMLITDQPSTSIETRPNLRRPDDETQRGRRRHRRLRMRPGSDASLTSIGWLSRSA